VCIIGASEMTRLKDFGVAASTTATAAHLTAAVHTNEKNKKICFFFTYHQRSELSRVRVCARACVFVCERAPFCIVVLFNFMLILFLYFTFLIEFISLALSMQDALVSLSQLLLPLLLLCLFI